jgi:ubiquinone/menaquinone biosynthesis C-methylase UbiE
MFFRWRSTQAEYFERPQRSEAEIVQFFHDLDRLNRLFLFSRPFMDTLPHWLGREGCKRLEILDIGAGTGLLSRQLSDWARKHHWDWRFTNLDASPVGLHEGKASCPVVASALKLPFADASFDLVVASQMTHHLTDEQVVLHLGEAWRVTRSAVMVCDLHRNPGLYAMLWLCTPFLGVSRHVRDDALISVKRGFRLPELRDFATRAGWTRAEVRLYCGTRIILRARKTVNVARSGMGTRGPVQQTTT